MKKKLKDDGSGERWAANIHGENVEFKKKTKHKVWAARVLVWFSWPSNCLAVLYMEWNLEEGQNSWDEVERVLNHYLNWFSVGFGVWGSWGIWSEVEGVELLSTEPQWDLRGGTPFCWGPGRGAAGSWIFGVEFLPASFQPHSWL